MSELDYVGTLKKLIDRVQELANGHGEDDLIAILNIDTQLTFSIYNLLGNLREIYNDGINTNNKDEIIKKTLFGNKLYKRYNQALQFGSCYDVLFKASESSLWMVESLSRPLYGEILRALSVKYSHLSDTIKSDFLAIQRSYSFKGISIDDINKELNTDYKSIDEVCAFVMLIQMILTDTLPTYNSIEFDTDMLDSAISAVRTRFNGLADEIVNRIQNGIDYKMHPFNGIVYRAGYKILKFIDIPKMHLKLHKDMDEYLLEQLKDYEFTVNTLKKMEMVGVDYKGLTYEQAIYMQIIKEYLHLYIEGPTRDYEIGNPDNYEYASALYFDEDLSHLTNRVLKRLDILALTSTPFRRAIKIANSAETYTYWWKNEADKSVNTAAIIETESNYSESLYND